MNKKTILFTMFTLAIGSQVFCMDIPQQDPDQQHEGPIEAFGFIIESIENVAPELVPEARGFFEQLQPITNVKEFHAMLGQFGKAVEEREAKMKPRFDEFRAQIQFQFLIKKTQKKFHEFFIEHGETTELHDLLGMLSTLNANESKIDTILDLEKHLKDLLMLLISQDTKSFTGTHKELVSIVYKNIRKDERARKIKTLKEAQLRPTEADALIKSIITFDRETYTACTMIPIRYFLPTVLEFIRELVKTAATAQPKILNSIELDLRIYKLIFEEIASDFGWYATEAE